MLSLGLLVIMFCAVGVSVNVTLPSTMVLEVSVGTSCSPRPAVDVMAVMALEFEICRELDPFTFSRIFPVAPRKRSMGLLPASLSAAICWVMRVSTSCEDTVLSR